MARFLAACAWEEVPEDRGHAVELEGQRLAIFRDADRAYALSARCPHAAGPLDRGWVEDGEAVCPLHRWRFRLHDGRCTTIRGEWVRSFACEVRDGWVWVDL